MHFDGPIYRPPPEWNTPLLQVTVGCSYNRCAFCTMYRNTCFHISPESEIIDDLLELSPHRDNIHRIFLLNGDPFVLSTDKLLRISQLVHQYLPKVDTLTCYCSIGDLRNKTFDDLVALRKAGYNQLYIGLETGYEPALKFITKGYTIAEAERILENLLRAGFDYNALLMNGIAGKGRSEVSVAATAKLLNAHKPKMVALLSTAVSSGTPLEEMRNRGEYTELTEREQIEEELMLLQALEMDDDCYFFGSHPFNLVPVNGYFSQKQELMEQIAAEMMEYEPDFLDSVWQRGSI